MTLNANDSKLGRRAIYIYRSRSGVKVRARVRLWLWSQIKTRSVGHRSSVDDAFLVYCALLDIPYKETP